MEVGLGLGSGLSALPLAASAATQPAMEAEAPGLSLSRAVERAEALKSWLGSLGQVTKPL